MSSVLVVENERGFREVLVEVLHEEGYSILEAPSADAAVDLLGTSSVRLIVTDVNLPGRLSGIDLAIKARDLCPAFRSYSFQGASARWLMPALRCMILSLFC